jgi:hypothetical protein
MNPWLFPWWSMFKAPWSGDVTQDMATITSWLSPQFQFNFAGNRRIEGKVVADVASYGRQLGILSEAVLELAAGQEGKAVARLKDLVAEVEKVKRQDSGKLEEQARALLAQLERQDPEALGRVLDEHRNR